MYTLCRLILLFGLLTVQPNLIAQEFKPGDEIVVLEKANVAIGSSIVDQVSPGQFFTIEKLNGKWLWLNTKKEGWVEQQYVSHLNREAIDRLTELVRSQPNANELYFSRAYIWKELGELDIALAEYTECIKRSPSSQNHNNRGVIWMDKGELGKALPDFNEAIRLDPKNYNAVFNRGLLWHKKTELDKAIADFNEAIRLDPKRYIAFDSRGDVWKEKDELDKAMADYNEAVRLNPKFAGAFFNRGHVWQKKNELNKAISEYDETIRLNPKFEDAFVNRGIAWAKKNELGKAIADFDEAIRLNPKIADAFAARGDAWFKEHELDKAFADFNEAIRLQPKKSEYFSRRGQAWAAKGELDKALNDYNQSIQLHKLNIPALERRAMLWTTKGDFDKAMADCKLLIENGDGDGDDAGWYMIGVIKVLRRDLPMSDNFRKIIHEKNWKKDYSLYSTLFGYFSLRLENDNTSAQRLLVDSQGKLDESWPYPIVQFLRGEIDEKKLVERDLSIEEKTELHCYLAYHHLVEGRPKTAREHFTWVSDKGWKFNFEHAIAIHELKRLDETESKP